MEKLLKLVLLQLGEEITSINLKIVHGTEDIEEKSLQKIFAIVFGQRISKNQQLTNWENDVLTDKQKLYAATDAWACLEIYNKLEHTK